MSTVEDTVKALEEATGITDRMKLQRIMSIVLVDLTNFARRQLKPSEAYAVLTALGDYAEMRENQIV